MEIILLLIIVIAYELVLMQNERKYNKLFNRYTELREEAILNIDINKIRIKKSFKNPRELKMRKREEYFIKNGEFESIIKIDDYGVLRDGYTSYLLAKKYNIKNVEFIRV